MHLSLPTLLTISLAHLASTHPTQTVLACLSFTDSVGTQSTTIINGTTTSLPYTVTASLLSSSSSDPANATTLSLVCTYNATLQYDFFGQPLDCAAGYTGKFLWGLGEVSFTTPGFPSFLGEDPAFVVNGTVRSDGSATDYRGAFGCDAGGDKVTAWY
ncbi:hypothetical protein L207DRAFT_517672, partial [Hyaloscypha variabilis F]